MNRCLLFKATGIEGSCIKWHKSCQLTNTRFLFYSEENMKYSQIYVRSHTIFTHKCLTTQSHLLLPFCNYSSWAMQCPGCALSIQTCSCFKAFFLAKYFFYWELCSPTWPYGSFHILFQVFVQIPFYLIYIAFLFVLELIVY